MVLSLDSNSFATEREEGATTAIAGSEIGTPTFEWLYQRYLDRVYAYLVTRMRNPEDAADLTQQVFVRVLVSLPSFRGGIASSGAWLFSIARNTAIDAIRQRDKVWCSAEGVLTRPAAAGDEPEAVALRREFEAEVQAALSRLSAEERELIALRFAAGLSSSDIAQVTGKSAGSVKKRLTRLLRRLEEHYHDPR